MTIGTVYVIVGQFLLSDCALPNVNASSLSGIDGATPLRETRSPIFSMKRRKTMTLQQLHYAITISETGSLNKAAEILYVAQPSLTGSMQELAKELGITIFHRSGRGVSLTNDGLEFITYARQVYHQYEILVDKYGRSGKRKKKFGVACPH